MDCFHVNYGPEMSPINLYLWWWPAQWANEEGTKYMVESSMMYWPAIITRAGSRFASSQWEMALLCNNVSHWLAHGDSHGVSNHQQSNCLFNDLWKLTTRRHESSELLVLCGGNLPPLTAEFPSQRASNKIYSCHEVIMMEEGKSSCLLLYHQRCWWLSYWLLCHQWMIECCPFDCLHDLDTDQIWHLLLNGNLLYIIMISLRLCDIRRCRHVYPAMADTRLL